MENIDSPQIRKASIILPNMTNPFSLRNVEKAKATLAANNPTLTSVTTLTGGSVAPKFVYFKFNPQSLTQAQFLALENDSTVTLMEIPFANMAIYSETFALDEAKADQLKDGSIYGITPIENSNAFTQLNSGSLIQTQYLDTLVQIAEMDTTLQFQSFREAGATETDLNKFRICLFKRPHGFVTYRDDQFNRNEGVRGMQVWSLFMGIPVYTYSDDRGYYEIPWKYSIGTIMGTKAKNKRVNIKPLDTHGTLVRNIYTLMAQFIVGSTHVEGWVTPCQMKDGKDFIFTGHTQVRYWSQLLNAYYFHDQYTAEDRIDAAPQSMVCYAQWGNTKDFLDANSNPDFGNASTFMLGHFNLTSSLVEMYINSLFDGDVIPSTQYPNLFNLLTGLAPDMSFRVPQAAEPALYNSRLAQLAFHELGHASHFRKVGSAWWALVGDGEIPSNGGRRDPTNPYGNGTYSTAGYVALTESWAEFIGMNYQLRRYPPNTVVLPAINNAFNTCTRSRTYLDGITLTSTSTIEVGQIYPSQQLIENQMYFFGGGDWIPMGLYHDLMDNTTTAPNNRMENWDLIQGVTIKQMYDAFGPTITTPCDYFFNFRSRNSTLNGNNVNSIFANHNIGCL